MSINAILLMNSHNNKGWLSPEQSQAGREGGKEGREGRNKKRMKEASAICWKSTVNHNKSINILFMNSGCHVNQCNTTYEFTQ